jgi:UDP-3-O-[3-hydroxymyristoyl] N-acetylglucosamine deacetylase
MKQNTLKKKITFEGIGIHSGKTIRIVINPAPIDTGIYFVRNDINPSVAFKATYENVIKTQLATTLGNDNQELSTVEHLLGAFAGLSIHNACIEVNGPELPILDGSGWQFYKAIQETGITEQSAPMNFLKILKPISVQSHGKKAEVTPSHFFSLSFSIYWDHPLIKKQEFFYDPQETPFSEIVQARTFGFLKDVKILKEKGLIQGGSLDNAIVLSSEEVLNPSGLRFKDEFVRHKILDALGDLSLAGMPIIGNFSFHSSGHELHLLLLKEIFSNNSNYCIENSLEEECFEETIKHKAASF